MLIDGNLILQAGTEGGKLTMKWFRGWEEWHELHQDSSFKELVTVANDALNRKSSGGKAVAKGKGGHKGL